MTARVWAYVMAAAATAYMAFAVWQAFLFARSGSPLALALAVAVLALPLIGLWLVWREIAFAARVQRLADALAARGELPPELPRTAGGRVEPAAAAAEFVRCEAGVAVEPESSAAWFALAWAYEAGRDRKRARAAMRHAVALADGSAAVAPARLTEQGESDSH
ncbi:MAG: hypothetical protein RLZ55_768 [Actinomycetota bacterium]